MMCPFSDLRTPTFFLLSLPGHVSLVTLQVPSSENPLPVPRGSLCVPAARWDLFVSGRHEASVILTPP